MTKFLLFLLFFVMLASDTLGLNLSLGPGLSVKNAFIYLLFLFIAVEAALKRDRNPELLGVIASYTLCVIYAAVTWAAVLLFIDYPGYSARGALINLKSGFADHVVVFLIFFYGLLVLQGVERLMRALIWTVVVANVVTVVDVFNIPDLGWIHERRDGRVGGPFGEANQYAAFLTLMLPAIVALFYQYRGALRVLAATGALISIFAFLLTVSRGGVVGLVTGAVLSIWLLRRYLDARMLAAIGGGVLGLGVVGLGLMFVTGYGDLIYERFVGASATGSAFEFSSGRSNIWRTAMSKMFEEPVTLLTGYGWDAYRYFPEFSLAPHNTYLKILFELGLIGLTLLLISFAGIVRVATLALEEAGNQRRPLILAFIYGFISFSIAIFFVDLTTPWILIWAYVGVMMRFIVTIRNRAPATHSEPAEHRPKLMSMRLAR